MKKFIATIFICFVLAGGIVGVVLKKLHQKEQAGQVQSSKVVIPQIHETIIEGWTVQDIADDLMSNAKRTGFEHLVNAQDFLDTEKNFSSSNYPLLASKPVDHDLEGFLFPDTYFLPQPSTSTDESAILIKRALDNFSQKFSSDMAAAAQKRGMSVYTIVTLASIIERETGKNAVTDQQKQQLDSERKIIAGLFYNRLRLGMPLQSDATVNYITKKNTPAVSLQDTKIDSPYNTYMYKGLPPGPICNPSLSSLMAAIYPEDTDYIYFLSDPKTGKAIFAQTLEEQIKHKQQYLK